MKKIIKVYKKKFIEWYFEDDMLKDIGMEAYRGIKKAGKYSISLNTIYKSVGYIPQELIKNRKVIAKEDKDVYELADPSANYNVKWV